MFFNHLNFYIVSVTGSICSSDSFSAAHMASESDEQQQSDSGAAGASAVK
jgi:hypothetical protein